MISFILSSFRTLTLHSFAFSRHLATHPTAQLDFWTFFLFVRADAREGPADSPFRLLMQETAFFDARTSGSSAAASLRTPGRCQT